MNKSKDTTFERDDIEKLSNSLLSIMDNITLITYCLQNIEFTLKNIKKKSKLMKENLESMKKTLTEMKDNLNEKLEREEYSDLNKFQKITRVILDNIFCYTN